MACLQSPCLSSINLKLSASKLTLFPRTHFLKPFKVSSSADSSPYPPQNLSTIGQNPLGTVEDGEEGTGKVPEAVRAAMEKAMEYKMNKGLVGAALSEVGVESTNEDDGEEPMKIPDRVKSALEKARAYKMNKGLVRAVENEVKTEVYQSPVEPADEDDGEETKKIPDRVKSALEKAREYKLNKGLVRAVKNEVKTEAGQSWDEPDRGTRRIPDEIRIGIERAREYMKNNGLASASDNTKNGGNEVIQDEDFPEVEIIVGDATKLGNQMNVVEQMKKDREDQRYKPKITRWIQ